MIRHLPRTAALFLAASAALAAPAAGQSALASRGLGYTLDPVDARVRALGGVALGLPGLNLSLVNPAEMVVIPAPALSIAYEPGRYDAEAPGQATAGDFSRFPLIHAALPLGRRGSVSLGFGSFLDQHWSARVQDSVVVEGVRRGVTDVFRSEGGISRLRVSAGYRVAERLSLAVGADLFTGVVRDTVSRVINLGTGPDTTAFGSDREHRGVGFTAGLRWVPAEPVVISAAVSGGGNIEAEVEETDALPGVSRSYPNPLTFDVGASGRLGGSTVLAVSGRWAGWSAADDELAASGGARDATTLSAGVEYEGLSAFGRVIPLRLGGRMAQLPFRWGGVADDLEFPTERAVSGGFGLRLGGGAALADVAAERGWRGGDAAGLDESYWRLSFSLSLLGR